MSKRIFKNRRQRAAIDKSKIRQQSRFLGVFHEGVRAARMATLGENVECPYPVGGDKAAAWLNGFKWQCETEELDAY